MTKSKHVRRIGLACAAGFALTSSLAIAAEQGTEAQVTIRADRPTAKVVGYSTRGVPVQGYQLAYHVSYSDLDLAKSADVDTLKQRVHEAASSLCKDLDKLYPPTAPDSGCTSTAELGAMGEVNKAIKLAQALDKAKAK